MDLTLYLGDRAYSSWSLRGWLLLQAFGINFHHTVANMRTDAFEAMRTEMAPARLVPALRVSGLGHKPLLVWDSLAIAETINELFPDAGIWPQDVARRATARTLAAEMHSGFMALRQACPMNMRRAYSGFQPNDDVMSDLARLQEVWAHAREGVTDGPFLCGEFCAADAFFAPVASRIATYDLPLDSDGAAYVAALLSHPAVQQWYADAKADPFVQAHYEFDLPDRPNPHDQSG